MTPEIGSALGVDLDPDAAPVRVAAHGLIVAPAGARGNGSAPCSLRLQRFSSATQAAVAQHARHGVDADRDRSPCHSLARSPCSATARRPPSRRGWRGSASRRASARPTRWPRRGHARPGTAAALHACGPAGRALLMPRRAASARSPTGAPYVFSARPARRRWRWPRTRARSSRRATASSPARSIAAGRTALATGAPRQAALLLERALAEPPARGERACTRLLLARALTLLRRPARARPDLRGTLRRDPTRATADQLRAHRRAVADRRRRRRDRAGVPDRRRRARRHRRRARCTRRATARR